MSFSAFSFGVALLAGAPPAPDGWAQAEVSVAYLEVGAETSAVATFIGGDGLFLTHADAATVSQGPRWVRTADGRGVPALILAIDELTQLALLQTEGGATMGLRPVTLTWGGPGPGEALVVATTLGPVPADLGRTGVPGQMRPSLRYAPLSEIRLESGDGEGLLGAPIFDRSGELVGLLNATVSPLDDRTGGAGMFGPIGVFVGYALDTAVLRRVIDGFLSPDRRVEHPAIGMFWREGDGGVVVESVLPDSQAALSGLREGDLIVAMDGVPLSGAVDLAVRLFGAEIGEALLLEVRRDGATLSLDVTVGDQSECDRTS